MKLLKVYDEYVQLYKYRIQNATICCSLGPVQLVISAASLGQHVYSLLHHYSVFECYFDRSERYLTTDIAIYDFGLFSRLWNIQKCIAMYLDGGYMRFLWCINHVISLTMMLLIVGFVRKPRAFLMCPVLTMQSFYSIGLSVLTLSALPKILPLFFGTMKPDLVLPLAIYISGVTMNCFLTYILWHYYWFLCGLHMKPPKPKKSKELLILEENIAEEGKYPMYPSAAPLLTIIDTRNAEPTVTVV